jgi:hypothetical protein
MLHTRPVQQSPVEVQLPAAFTQVTPPSLGCRQRRTPWPSGTHGVPPQHSAEKVHLLPAVMQQGGVPV